MVKERDLLEEETIDLASRNLPGDFHEEDLNIS
jgi:hypothetical protein